MKNKSFVKIVAVILIVGVLSTAALVAYTCNLLENASLTAFISGE